MISPPPAIIDTNVLVSGLITGDNTAPTCAILDGMLQGAFPFALSVDLLHEYRQVLLRPKIRELHGLGENAIDVILEAITANAILRDASATTDPSPDSGDQHLWNLLAAMENSVLVTGDRQLLEHPPAFARVLSPSSFLKIGR